MNLLVTEDQKLNISQWHAVAKKAATPVSCILSKPSVLLSTAFPPLQYRTVLQLGNTIQRMNTRL